MWSRRLMVVAPLLVAASLAAQQPKPAGAPAPPPPAARAAAPKYVLEVLGSILGVRADAIFTSPMLLPVTANAGIGVRL